MAKSEFSETQFVFGFLFEYMRTLTNRWGFVPWTHFSFPTQVMESLLPVDFWVDTYFSSEFYQFKRSDYMYYRRGDVEIRENIPIDFLEYYRFKIYNTPSQNRVGQFDKLRELAAGFPQDKVYYCAPCFSTEYEYHDIFRRREILKNSILIECDQFNDARFNAPNFDINDGLGHNLVYRIDKDYGYLCSEPIKVSTSNALEITTRKFDSGESDDNLIDKIVRLQSYLSEDINNDYDSRYENIPERIAVLQRVLMRHYNTLWIPTFSNRSQVQTV